MTPFLHFIKYLRRFSQELTRLYARAARLVASRGHIVFNNLALAKVDLAAIILGSSALG